MFSYTEHLNSLTFLLSLSLSLCFSLQTCRLTSQWHGRSKCILEGHDPSRLWPGQTGLRSCNRTWNVPFVFCFVSLFCWKGGKFLPLHLSEQKNRSSWQHVRQSLHKKHYVTVTKIIKAQAGVVSEDALFFLFSLWLVSSKPLKMWFILRAALFLCEHIFGVRAATCLHYLYDPHYICFTVRLVPCGTNRFLIKNANVNDLEGVCLSAFTGCQLPFSCSTAAQCEAAAAVADLGALVLCKAAALLVAEHGRGATFLQIQLDRRSQVLIERPCVHEHCFALPYVCCVFAVAVTCVRMCDGGGRGTQQWHNNGCVP